MRYIVALDQGTTSSRAILFDESANPVYQESREFAQIYPRPGYVEHDPEEIFSSQITCLTSVVEASGVSVRDIAAIGVTNQRETVVLWEKNTGKPIYNAIVWQCRRTADICEKLKADGYADMIKKKTGLLIDAYFSATKIQWVLDNVPDARKKAENGEILCGTIDTWLIWRLTRGRAHVTDVSNASRTMLFNIHTLKWDEELLRLFAIPACILPKVMDTSSVYGYTDPDIVGFSLPIASAVGDQQAALFGQACFRPGDMKNTYGTGCFALMNTGKTACMSKKGLLTTVAWSLNGEATYALEGSVFIGGALIQWLRDGLMMIASADEINTWADRAESSSSLYIVPAFVGLGTPHWDMYARGLIIGLTRGSGKAEICRAALDAIAYQVKDVLALMQEESGCEMRVLRVDGGASLSRPLMQFQADIMPIRVERPRSIQTTALGAAYLAGLAVGVWPSMEAIGENWARDSVFMPEMAKDRQKTLHQGWLRAVERAKGWAKDAHE